MLPMTRALCLLIAIPLAAGCDADPTSTAEPVSTTWSGKHVQTLLFGPDDNSEIIKLLPSGERAVLVASKSRKVTLLDVATDQLSERESVRLFENDATESELTHIDIDKTGTFGAVTRTLPITESGEQVDCRGSLVFINLAPGAGFGAVLAEVPVGGMPDSVDISPDGKWAITADEVDYNDGKCAVATVTPSVSILSLPGGAAEGAHVVARIELESEGEGSLREPEQVIFAADSDHVAITLQDTHEVLFFRLSELTLGEAEPAIIEGGQLRIERIPNRADGAEPWPDGVQTFIDAAGVGYFVTAGEYNDTFAIYTLAGDFVRQVEIRESDLPSDFPRNIEEWSLAPFRPDSIAPFSYGGHSYLAFSLKHAGAVGVWRVDSVDAVALASAIKIGDTEGGTASTESTIGTEGISAGPGGLIVTANEGESSASLVAPLSL